MEFEEALKIVLELAKAGRSELFSNEEDEKAAVAIKTIEQYFEE